MNTHESDFIGEASKEIAADPRIVNSSLAELATRWSELMVSSSDELEPAEIVVAQQALTGAAYHEVVAKKLVEVQDENDEVQLIVSNVSPTDYLRGELGADAQSAFLSGAMMAVEKVLNSSYTEIS